METSRNNSAVPIFRNFRCCVVVFKDTITQKCIDFKRGVINICEECRRFPCDPRCPNAPEPPVVCECDLCGEAIREGDTLYKLGEHKYCEECVEYGREEAEVEAWY